MENNNIENCSKMLERVFTYATLNHINKNPDKRLEDVAKDIGGNELFGYLHSLLEGSLVLYHQSLQKSLLKHGHDIGDFPDITLLDVELPVSKSPPVHHK